MDRKFFDIELRAKGFSTQIIHFGDALKYVCSQYDEDRILGVFLYM